VLVSEEDLVEIELAVAEPGDEGPENVLPPVSDVVDAAHNANPPVLTAEDIPRPQSASEQLSERTRPKSLPQTHSPGQNLGIFDLLRP
jgi:nicotinamidase-related amidase